MGWGEIKIMVAVIIMIIIIIKMEKEALVYNNMWLGLLELKPPAPGVT